MKEKLPLTSIIIVNFNGKKYLINCLNGVFANRYRNYEVIVVDNGSNDESVLTIKKIFSRKNNLKVVALSKNFGPAFARNQGVKKAKGKYLAFLDNDTFPDKNWLQLLIPEMEKDKTIGACQCKLLLLKEPDKFDYAGDYLNQWGFLVQRVEGGEKDFGQADQKVEILSAKSAAMVIRKDVFEKIGGFDEDYFIYLEETDLSWRTWLAGYRVIFIPKSRVYHEFGTTSIIDPNLQNFNVKFHGTKNYIITNFKNLGSENLIKILIPHLLLWMGIGSWLIIKRQFKSGFFVLKGIGWFFWHIKKIWRKRILIQKKRAVSDKELMPKILIPKPFSYFYKKLSLVEKVGNAEGWIHKKLSKND